MDTSRDGYRYGETAALRARVYMRTLIRVAGIALVVLGGLNLLGVELWVGYRVLYPSVTVVGNPETVVYVADAAVAAAGAVLAFFV